MGHSRTAAKPVSPALEITFRCAACSHTFSEPPGRVEDAPEKTWHPYEYFADCPICTDEVEQVAWEKNLFKAHSKATGPTTFEGKRIAAANLDGHPTPEESKRTRFNALKHGASAKTAMYFPARPGSYPQCETCDVDHDYCATQTACIRRTELMMRYLSAVETGDVSVLSEIHAVNQASLVSVFQDILLTIVKDGVSLRHNVYAFDKEGGYHEGTIQEVKAHPLLKPMLEFLSRNNMSMADLNLTPKVQIDQGIELGKVSQEQEDRDSANELRERQNKMLEDLSGMIERSKQRVRQDPVYVEYQQDADSETAEVIDDQS